MNMEGLLHVKRFRLDCAGGLLAILQIILLTASPIRAEVRIIPPARTCSADPEGLKRSYSESFPAESTGDLLKTMLGRMIINRDQCLEAASRFDEQIDQRLITIKEAAADIARFSSRYPTCNSLVTSEKTSIVIVSYPININGKLFGDLALINLFATKGDPPEQFHRLILHEWIHGFKTQHSNESDNISNLLFSEGQATFGVLKVSKSLSGMSIESSLDISPEHLTQAIELMCRIPWTSKQLGSQIMGLFSGGDRTFAQPRMGYFLGAKIIERLERSRSWCEIDLSFFRQHYEKILEALQNEYCTTERGNNDAQNIRL